MTQLGDDLRMYLRGALILYDEAAQQRIIEGVEPYILALEARYQPESFDERAQRILDAQTRADGGIPL